MSLNKIKFIFEKISYQKQTHL